MLLLLWPKRCEFANFFVSLQANMAKNLYIICGCNGAGKTTASYTVLPEILDCREFVNADEIARGLSPFNPSSVAIEAGKLIFIIKNYTIILLLMSDKEFQDLDRKLDAGLRLAHKRMLEEKALHDETVVVSNAEGQIEYIPAKEVLATY